MSFLTNWKVKRLMPRLIASGRANNEDARQLYDLYNEIFNQNETDYHCGGCRSKVFNAMKRYFEELTQKKP